MGWGTAPWGTDGYDVDERTDTGGRSARLPAEVKAMGVPPHWLTYISTPDARPQPGGPSDGGRILKPVEVVPTVGRFIVVADPQGAVFCLYQPDNDMALTPCRFPAAGHGTSSPPPIARSLQVLLGAVGWVKTGDMDMGEAGIYQMYGSARFRWGHLQSRKKCRVNWLPYAMV